MKNKFWIITFFYIIPKHNSNDFSLSIRYENAPNTHSVRDEFTKCLQTIRLRHKDVVPTMAEAVMLMKSQHSQQHLAKTGVESCIQYFLDRLYMSRISIHMLINQHTIIYGDEAPMSPIHVGSIDPYCDVPMIVEDAFSNAAFLCDQHYLQSPELDLEVTPHTRRTVVDDLLMLCIPRL